MAISHQPAILDAAERAYRLVDGKAFLVSDLSSNDAQEMNASIATA
ncbi:MAG: hypothetical protein JRF72_19210 [Deltaproteobacteria bacterium]|nr:hypothetical protein [Deltaproteobacteria bacterium]